MLLIDAIKSWYVKKQNNINSATIETTLNQIIQKWPYLPNCCHSNKRPPNALEWSRNERFGEVNMIPIHILHKRKGAVRRQDDIVVECSTGRTIRKVTGGFPNCMNFFSCGKRLESLSAMHEFFAWQLAVHDFFRVIFPSHDRFFGVALPLPPPPHHNVCNGPSLS